MNKVLIYTTNNCPFCTRAKELLKRKGVGYEEMNLGDKPEELVALKAKTGLRTVPQVFIADKLIGGFQELAALDASGELDKVLGKV